MSTDGHNRILYGANRIRAYKGDELHWELSPDGFSMLDTDVSGTIAVTNPNNELITYKLWRQGHLRFLAVSTFATTNVTGAVIATKVALDVQDRPAAAVYEDVIVINATVYGAGSALLGTDGILTVGAGYGATPPAFTGNAGAGGFMSFIMMYQVASPLATW